MRGERTVQVHVKKFDPIGGGRFQVKIMENEMNLTNITHDGESYATVKKLGRGRYIVKKDIVSNQEETT